MDVEKEKLLSEVYSDQKTIPINKQWEIFEALAIVAFEVALLIYMLPAGIPGFLAAGVLIVSIDMAYKVYVYDKRRGGT